MKNIIKFGILALITVFAMTACDPQEGDNHSLGTPDTVTAGQVSFSYAASPTNDNIITFTNTSDTKVPYSFLWDLGNGVTSKDKAITGEYPFAGDYTVTLTLYTADGSATVNSQVIHIDKNDYSLLNTPMYIALTGGLENTNGKTWVFDRTQNGHFGVGPIDSDTPSWWSCEAEGKANCSLYNQEFTFTLSGVILKWTNGGKIYTNEPGRAALAALGYTKSSVPPAGDFDVEYAPKESYTFSLSESTKTLTLSSGVFFGHYTGSSKYTILSLTEDELYLKVNSTVESGSAWWYRFVPKK
ncbi:PKD domain-containing protein [Dysgonomonas sp. ZJ279]|uniref:PKD domain-containing protein n=1 Tax=Dysgonomonas sp. ZJ279 TaxID=2709796 RepID=UPI0013ECA999|nr:PKD domain-containing protein [Dysgonomonas sp. ZJ279]